MEYPCGGNGRCGKCVVRFTGKDVPEPNAVEQSRFTEQELAAGLRLACQTDLTLGAYEELYQQGIMVIEDADTVKSRQQTNIPGEDTAVRDGDLGVAVDLGTTTIAMALVDLKTGETLATHTCANPQRKYGADVMSRMQQANGGQAKALQESIRECLEQGVKTLTDRVNHIVIAGNTTMCHLLLGWSCETLAVAPFTPVCLAPEPLEYQHIPVTVLPGASAFIGGDIIAGLYALDALQWQQPTLFLDLGTNGEMVLWTGKEFLATSAAAGPAFEGGNISCGVAGIYGAVNDVVIAGKKNGTTTIGGVPAVGICGSGLLAAISGMKKSGILDGNWILQQEFLDEGYPLTTPGAKSPIRITQEDVRQYLLAKSAIVSGYQILLQAGGLQETDLEEVELAGGLGMHLKVSYGIAAGLFPGTFQGKTKSVGNTSLQGAIKYLMQPGEGRHQMEEMIERLQVLSLAEQPGFEEKFIENLE